MKKILFLLVFCLFGLVSFGYCDNSITKINLGSQKSLSSSNTVLIHSGNCVKPRNTQAAQSFSYTDLQGNVIIAQNSSATENDVYCFGIEGYLKNNATSSRYYYVYSVGFVPGSECPLIDSGYCVSNNLCPICQECQECDICEECPLIDSGYCVSNDLCPISTGLNWSELVINDIVHQSAPLININIPDEFNWNYNVDENEFALSVSGYNVDTDYIDGIITTQNAKPSTEDFNKIITELIPLFVPGLVIILFLRFIFKFIKKIF